MSEAVFHAAQSIETALIHGYRIPILCRPHIQLADGDPASLAITLPHDFWGNHATRAYFDPRYYSEEHGAYKDGYTLETRVKKYKDAINNTVDVLVEHPGKFIDFGGGPGYFAYGVAQEEIKRKLIGADEVDKNVYVADISPIEDEAVKTSGITRVISGLADLPDEYRSGQFVMASCLHTMEHIPHDQIRGSIQAMHEALQQNGILYLIIPTLDGRIQQPQNQELYKQIVYDQTHITLATRKWWLKQFEDVGFTNNPSMEEKFDSKKYGWVFCFNKTSNTSFQD